MYQSELSLPYLVVTVHQPEQLHHIGVLGGADHLAAGAIDGPHDLAGGGRLLELHAPAAHDEHLALVILLGDVDKVPGRHHATAPIACHLEINRNT